MAAEGGRGNRKPPKPRPSPTRSSREPKIRRQRPTTAQVDPPRWTLRGGPSEVDPPRWTLRGGAAADQCCSFCDQCRASMKTQLEMRVCASMQFGSVGFDGDAVESRKALLSPSVQGLQRATKEMISPLSNLPAPHLFGGVSPSVQGLQCAGSAVDRVELQVDQALCKARHASTPTSPSTSSPPLPPPPPSSSSSSSSHSR